MNKLSQKEAVYRAVMAFLTEHGRSLESGDAVSLSTDDRKTVVAMIVGSIQAGDVNMSEEAAKTYDTPEKISTYTVGLLSNWLRKDSRLNGGTKHTIKNPGARAGQDDEVVKKLKALRKIVTRYSDIQKVDAEISLRLKEIMAPSESIDLAHIPEHLKHLVK
jgi:hypothetical protein